MPYGTCAPSVRWGGKTYFNRIQQGMRGQLQQDLRPSWHAVQHYLLRVTGILFPCSLLTTSNISLTEGPRNKTDRFGLQKPRSLLLHPEFLCFTNNLSHVMLPASYILNPRSYVYVVHKPASRISWDVLEVPSYDYLNR